ncbi:Ras family [Pelomyxa schiedti]|nr:Ras family [Pelomyxa schiedti]
MATGVVLSGEEAARAFSAKNAKETHEAKMVIVGNATVGKTCLLMRWATGNFSNKHQPTIGGAFLDKHIEIEGQAVHIKLWDTAGSERFRSMLPMYYRNTQAALIVYDVTNQRSFQDVKVWVEELRNYTDEHTVLAIAGNKSDLDTKMVSSEEAAAYASSINAMFAETSAKTNSGIDQLFLDICQRRKQLTRAAEALGSSSLRSESWLAGLLLSTAMTPLLVTYEYVYKVLSLAILCANAKSVYVINGLDGVHYDVEPHALPEWDSNWTSVGLQFLDLVSELKSLSEPEGLLLSFDLNADLDGPQCPPTCSITWHGTTKSLVEHTLDMLDWATLMAYFNDSSDIISHCQGEVSYATTELNGKTLAIGVNLEPADTASSLSETLADDGLDVMEQYLDDVWQTFSVDQSANIRFAIHHYGFYVNMSPGPVEDIPAHSRDIYWWCSDYANCDIYDESAEAEFADFCSAHASHNVYIDAPAIVALTPPSWDQQYLVDYITTLYARGIHTHLIFGQYNWALEENHYKAIKTLNNTIRMLRYYGNLTEISSSSSDSKHSTSRSLDGSHACIAAPSIFLVVVFVYIVMWI